MVFLLQLSLSSCAPSTNYFNFNNRDKSSDGSNLDTTAAIPRDEQGAVSDIELVRYKDSLFDKDEKAFKHEFLGINHGLRVIADYPCSDLCPDEAVRVIHYDKPPGANCEKAGGLTESIDVPMAAAVGPVEFCVPKVLALKQGHVR